MIHPFPADMRTAFLSSKDVIRVSLGLMRRMFIAMAVLFMVIPFVFQAIKYSGLSYLVHPTLWLGPVSFFVALYVFWLGLVFWGTRKRVMNSKGLDRDIAYGFDDTALYSRSVFFESCIAWEYFRAWAETPQYLLLHDGTRAIMLPKAPWSAEEQERLRGLLRGKATPGSVPEGVSSVPQDSGHAS